MTIAPKLRRTFRPRPRAGTGVTALFLAGLAISAAAAGFLGTAVEPATAGPAVSKSVASPVPAGNPANNGRRS